MPALDTLWVISTITLLIENKKKSIQFRTQALSSSSSGNGKDLPAFAFTEATHAGQLKNIL